MKYNIFNSDNNMFNSDTLLFIIIILSILFIINYIYPTILDKSIYETFEIDTKLKDIIDKYYKNTSNNNELHRIDKKICSKQCCKFTQWPVPFNTKNPIISDTILDNFIPSNFSCNLGNSSGCVCVTKEDYNYLANHGQ
jgi:hypothetical protein